MPFGFARARKGAPCQKPGVLALLLVCACAAEDKVLTPDDEKDGGTRDAAAANDSGQDAGALADAGGNKDASIGGGDAGKAEPKNPECDLNGVWIGRQNTESLALFDTKQYANNWYYLELRQEGEQVVVTKHFDCGIEVHGTVLVRLQPATTRALMMHNSQLGRRGTFAKQSDGTCAFEMERFWSVRGVSEDTYAPVPRSADTAIPDLQPKLPSKSMVATTEDWDDDGKPGVTWVVTGIVNGERYSSQRDWTRWFSAADGYTIQASEDFVSDLVVRAEFSNEEIVYAPTKAELDQISTPNASAKHALTLRFLGRSTDDPRAASLIKSGDFETCAAIQAALPALEGFK
jgi:hypothetical protein